MKIAKILIKAICYFALAALIIQSQTSLAMKRREPEPETPNSIANAVTMGIGLIRGVTVAVSAYLSAQEPTVASTNAVPVAATSNPEPEVLELNLSEQDFEEGRREWALIKAEQEIESSRLATEKALQAGLLHYKPTPTSSGVSGSFFLKNVDGEIKKVFKPMAMEANGPKNDREYRVVAWFFGTPRKSVLPGQAAGNEVLMYHLDQALGGRYHIPRTELVLLAHEAWGGAELGSAQDYIEEMLPLGKLFVYELKSIPRQEFDRFNIKLISGGTDGHYNNFLCDRWTGKIGIIDAGYDFVGQKNHSLLKTQQWVELPQASQPMSKEEYEALHEIDVDQVMNEVDAAAKRNEAKSKLLHFDTAKSIGLRIRLELAKIIGEKELTQKEWHSILAGGTKVLYGFALSIKGEYAAIYDEVMRPVKASMDRKAAEKIIDWEYVRRGLKSAAEKRIQERE